MATVTYIGEEDGPDTMVLAGIAFKRGQGLEVLDYPTFQKAKASQAFKVDGDVKKPEEPKVEPAKPAAAKLGEKK